VKGWPQVLLREVLTLDLHKEPVDSAKRYDMVGVLSYGRGLFRRPPIENGRTSYKHMLRLKSDHIVMSQLFGWEGALALSSGEYAGAYLSPNFPTFSVDGSRLARGFLGWAMRRPSFWDDLGTRAKGMGDRRRTLTPDSLLQSKVPLPPLVEQQALVVRLDALAEKVRQVEAHLAAAEREAEQLLALRFRDVIANAPLRSMAEVAPVVRRPVSIDVGTRYGEIGARSFGKGVFIKPDFVGAELTWQKPVWVKAGDIVLSNIKAWEGAIAIAGQEHDGRIASHRYITCVPHAAQVTAEFLVYYLLSEPGLEQIGFASPGTADRNRTLSLGSLATIQVPVPPLASQQSFGLLQAEVAALRACHAVIRAANAALLPAALERVFASA
jgi:type I restriction enzyme S subunit